MNDSLENIGPMAEGFHLAFGKAEKITGEDPLVAACVGLSTLTLHLAWALQWIDTLTDRMADDALTAEFLQDLKQRAADNITLEQIAKEVELL